MVGIFTNDRCSGNIFPASKNLATQEVLAMKVKVFVAQLCLTLHSPRGPWPTELLYP